MENGDDDNNIVGPPITIYFIAGCVAGAIESIATWPTEYIKTKLQLQKQRQDDRIAELVSPLFVSTDLDRILRPRNFTLLMFGKKTSITSKFPEAYTIL